MAVTTLSDIDWFEWNGVKCTASPYNMHVLSQPNIVSPLERIEQVTIPGRSGTLTLAEGDNIYDDIALSCSCVIDDPNSASNDTLMSRISAITGWLKGSGTVKFATRPGGYYKGRIANQISFEKAVQGNPHRLFSVQFHCEPFFYYDSGKTAITDVSGLITNPGNIPSQPLITLSKASGKDEGTIMLLNGNTMIVTFAGEDLETLDSITLDCEAKVAYTGNGTAISPYVLRGTRVQGDWITIPSGSQYISISDIGGISIIPRWRSI